MDPITSESLRLMKDAFTPDNLQKAGWSQPSSSTTGLQIYNLEQPSKKLFPVLTPLRNRIPRKGSKGGTAVNWKAVTAINSAKVPPGVSEGNRSGVVTTTTTDNNAAFKGLGLEDFVTFEADYAGSSFEDIRALSAENLLKALMIAEEGTLLWGNGSDGNALGTTPTPTAAAAAGAGLTAGTYSVIAVALTHRAWDRATLAAGVPGTVARTSAGPISNTDTINLGAAQKSAAAGVTTSGGNLSIQCNVTSVAGAVAYAWFIGSAGTERLQAITTVNSYLFTGTTVGSNQLASALTAADYSQDSLVFTGIMQQLWKSGSNAYIKSLDGANFTADGASGINEIETALQAFYDSYRLVPDLFLVASQEAKNMTKAILKGGSNPPAFRINVDGSGQTQATLEGGSLITSYLGKFGQMGGVSIPIQVHPNMAPGTMLMLSWNLPYPVNGVPSVWEIETRQEYYAIEWPRVQRKYEYGVYVDEVLKGYFPPACGIIQNIGNGVS